MTQDPLDKELQWIRSMHSFGCPCSMFLSSMFHQSRLKRLLKQQNSLWWDQDNLVFDIGIRWLSLIRGFLVLLQWLQCKAVPKSCCWWFWPRHLVAQQTTRHGNHGNRWRSTSCNGSIPLDMVTASISFTMKLPHGQKHMWLGAKLLEKNLRWQAGLREHGLFWGVDLWDYSCICLYVIFVINASAGLDHRCNRGSFHDTLIKSGSGCFWKSYWDQQKTWY